MPTRIRLVASVVLLAAVAAGLHDPLTVGAADVPVTYTVQAKPLKAAVAGTTLTFKLYNDSGCTNQVYSAGVLIENVTLIAKVKPFTPKNATKLPSALALHHTLPGVLNTTNLYLTVTGTGVTPTGGACQAQGVLVAVSTCTDGIQNQGETDVDCGGPTACPRCPSGKNCSATSDCLNVACMGGICQLPTCSDGIRNQDETDVDCGGVTCVARCGSGKNCLAGSDCSSSICMMGNCN